MNFSLTMDDSKLTHPYGLKMKQAQCAGAQKLKNL